MRIKLGLIVPLLGLVAFFDSIVAVNATDKDELLAQAIERDQELLRNIESNAMHGNGHEDIRIMARDSIHYDDAPDIPMQCKTSQQHMICRVVWPK